jgi:hypothetical protein
MILSCSQHNLNYCRRIYVPIVSFPVYSFSGYIRFSTMCYVLPALDHLAPTVSRGRTQERKPQLSIGLLFLSYYVPLEEGHWPGETSLVGGLIGWAATNTEDVDRKLT